ncbi:MAG: hypothetical protein JWQ09_1798 [Segetibacter sp.]|nr:hypothetical protein [Segetibacter sp.]
MAKGITFGEVGRTIFNLYLKASRKHRYYGSLRALYDDNGNDAIGISIHTLYARDDAAWVTPYENEKVIIERGELLTTGDIKKQ